MTVVAAIVFGWLTATVGVLTATLLGADLFVSAACGFVGFYVGFGWMLWRTATA